MKQSSRVNAAAARGNTYTRQASIPAAAVAAAAGYDCGRASGRPCRRNLRVVDLLRLVHVNWQRSLERWERERSLDVQRRLALVHSLHLGVHEAVQLEVREVPRGEVIRHHLHVVDGEAPLRRRRPRSGSPSSVRSLSSLVRFTHLFSSDSCTLARLRPRFASRGGIYPRHSTSTWLVDSGGLIDSDR